MTTSGWVRWLLAVLASIAGLFPTPVAAGAEIGASESAQAGFNYDEPVGIGLSSTVVSAGSVTSAVDLAGSVIRGPENSGQLYDRAVDLVAPNTAPPSTFTRTDALSGRPSSRQVTEIADELSTSGWNGPPIKVVDIDGGLYVVDGHHRLAAARRAGVDVPYEVVDASTVIGPGQWSSIDDILNDSFGVGPDRLRGPR